MVTPTWPKEKICEELRKLISTTNKYQGSRTLIAGSFPKDSKLWLRRFRPWRINMWGLTRSRLRSKNKCYKPWRIYRSISTSFSGTGRNSCPSSRSSWTHAISMNGLPRCRPSWEKILRLLRKYPCLKLWNRCWSTPSNCKFTCRWINGRGIIWCWNYSTHLRPRSKMLRNDLGLQSSYSENNQYLTKIIIQYHLQALNMLVLLLLC